MVDDSRASKCKLMYVSFSALKGPSSQLCSAPGWCVSGRVVGSVTHCPARNSARGDVAGRVHIGVLSEAARCASEGGLGGPVLLVDVAAPAACLRGVAGVHEYHRNPGTPGLVGDEGGEAGETP